MSVRGVVTVARRVAREGIDDGIDNGLSHHGDGAMCSSQGENSQLTLIENRPFKVGVGLRGYIKRW